MALEIFKITKRFNKNNNAVNVFSAENLLYGFKTPKISFKISQPSPNISDKYEICSFFLDIPEIYQLIQSLRLWRGFDVNNPSHLLRSFKGGTDKKSNNEIISRIFTAQIQENNTLQLRIDYRPGKQGYVLDKTGMKVPGPVMPVSGSKSIKCGSMYLTRAEAMYVGAALDKELTAWRVVLNNSRFSA